MKKWELYRRVVNGEVDYALLIEESARIYIYHICPADSSDEDWGGWHEDCEEIELYLQDGEPFMDQIINELDQHGFYECPPLTFDLEKKVKPFFQSVREDLELDLDLL